MITTEWDLYLDESGEFRYPKQHTLIGGVLIPHKKNPTLADFAKWEKDIRSRVEESDIFKLEHQGHREQ